MFSAALIVEHCVAAAPALACCIRMWQPLTVLCVACWHCAMVLQEGPEQLVWCKSSCGNNVHKQCFDKWAAAKRAGGQPITCVFCRAPWADASGMCCVGLQPALQTASGCAWPADSKGSCSLPVQQHGLHTSYIMRIMLPSWHKNMHARRLCSVHLCFHYCCVFALCAAGGAAAAGADGSSYLNLAQHSHQYEAADTSLEALYGDTAMWINHHQGGYAGRGGTARTWRSGYGRWR